MAKPLPFFKFYVDDWLLGRILELPPAVQGRFITFCALYWRRNCEVSEQFYHKSVPKVARKLLESESIIKVKGDLISIEFLDDQFKERIEIQKVKKKGGLARAKAYAEASAPANGQLYKSKDVDVDVDINRERGDLKKFIRAMYEDEAWNISIRQLYPRLRKGENTLHALNHFVSYCEASKTNHADEDECRAHFARWMKYQKTADIPHAV